MLLCVLAFALWFALWFATTLGLVHGVMHGGVAAAGTPVTVMHGAHAHGADGHGHGHGHGLAALFGDHSDAECRLYDQLSHGPAVLGVPLVLLPVALPAATFAWLEGEAIARWIALFDARGPPSTR